MAWHGLLQFFSWLKISVTILVESRVVFWSRTFNLQKPLRKMHSNHLQAWNPSLFGCFIGAQILPTNIQKPSLVAPAIPFFCQGRPLWPPGPPPLLHDRPGPPEDCAGGLSEAVSKQLLFNDKTCIYNYSIFKKTKKYQQYDLTSRIKSNSQNTFYRKKEGPCEWASVGLSPAPLPQFRVAKAIWGFLGLKWGVRSALVCTACAELRIKWLSFYFRLNT